MNYFTIGPITSETVIWQLFDDDPETSLPPLEQQGAGWYSWQGNGPWMDAFLSVETYWEEAFSWGYQSVMRYWPGEVQRSATTQEAARP